MNVDNGALEFTVSLDTEQMNRLVEETIRRIQGMSDSIVAEGQKMDGSFSGIENTINGLRNKIAQLERATADIDVDTEEFKQLNSELIATRRRLESVESGFDELDDSTKRTKGSLGDIKGLLAGAFAAVGIKELGSAIIDVAADFQKYEAVLTNTLGSQDEAKKIMGEIQGIAASTPFSLNELTESFVKLTNYGMQPSMEQMRQYGDISAAVGKSFDQFAEAIADASAGEFERLKEFGIKARKEGEQIAFTFKGQTTEIKNNATEIQNYLAGLGNMEGVKGSMEAISQTMEGQISNLKDNLDSMFNEIGQASSGFVSGSIDGLNFLIDNYESILKVLGLLVGAYGAYKTAIMLSTAAQRATVVGDQIKNFIALTKATKSAIVAQQALNAAQKANAIGLAITGITAIIGVVMAFRKEVKSAAEVQQSFNELQQQTADLDASDQLISRYEELREKQESLAEGQFLSNEEQAEYNSLIDELSKKYPLAIEQFDEHGKAIGMNTEKLKEYNEQQRQAMSIVAESDLTDALDSLEKVQKKFDKESYIATTGKEKVSYTDSFGNTTETDAYVTKRRQTKAAKRTMEYGDEVRGYMESIGDYVGLLGDDIDEELKKRLDELGIKLPTPEIDKLLNKSDIESEIKKIVSGIGDATDAELENKKIKLSDLLSKTDDEELKSQIQSEIDKIDNELKPRVAEQIEAIKQQLEAAKGELGDMRLETSVATPEEIEAQEKTIKELEKQLQTLTGATKKAGDKQVKDKEDRLKKIAELDAIELELQNKLNAAKVAAMDEGVEKQRAQAKLAYQQQIADIKEQEREHLDKFNAANGFKTGDEGAFTTLPTGVSEMYAQMRVNAENNLNNEITEINRQAANAISEIWENANSEFITAEESAINAVNGKYDGLIEKAKEAGASEEAIMQINAQRLKEIDEVKIESAIETLDSLREMEQGQIDNAARSAQQANILKLEYDKRYLADKIAILSKSGKEENKQLIEQLKEQLGMVDSEIKKAKGDALAQGFSDAGEILGSMGEAAGFLDEELADALDTMSGLATQGAQFVTSVSSGNWVGAITSGIGLMSTVMSELKESQEAANQRAQRMNELLSEQVDILLRAGVISETEAQIKTIEQLDAAIQNARNSLLDIKTETSTPWLDPELENMLNVVHGVGGWDDNTLLELQDPRMVRKLVSAYNDTLGFFDGFVYGLTVDAEEYAKRVNNLFDAIAERREYETQMLNESLGFADNEISSQIVDGLVNGYKLAEDGIGDYTDKFRDSLRKAVIEALTAGMDKEKIEALTKNISEAMKDGLTDDELKALQDEYKAIVEGLEADAALYSSILGDTAEEAEKKGMVGEAKALTEDTGGMIEGRLNSIQFNVIKTNEFLDSQLRALNDIKHNTSYNFHLQDIAGDIEVLKQSNAANLSVLKEIRDRSGSSSFSM